MSSREDRSREERDGPILGRSWLIRLSVLLLVGFAFAIAVSIYDRAHRADLEKVEQVPGITWKWRRADQR
jgi:hypothetical protein